MAGLRFRNLHKAFGAVEIIKVEILAPRRSSVSRPRQARARRRPFHRTKSSDTGSAVEFRFEPAAAHLFAA